LVSLPQIRGAILEEIVLRLLENAGYSILNESDGEEIRNGRNGLELQGRGEWHQVDALVTHDFTPSFIYPIRLIVEAKAYKRPVGITVTRNAVGVLKDVNENYFSYSTIPGVKLRRFNYAYAIFSLNGFTRNAQRYAIAHQIFLIQYYFNPLFKEIRRLLFQIDWETLRRGLEITELRSALRDYFRGRISEEDLGRLFVGYGISLINRIKIELNKIKGSYFGLLNGEYPIHLVSKKPLTGIKEDEIYVRVYIAEAKYVYLKFNDNMLYFELPDAIAEVFSKVWEDKMKVAITKMEYINYIALTGEIDGIRRRLILRLDRDWLKDYINSLKFENKIIHFR